MKIGAAFTFDCAHCGATVTRRFTGRPYRHCSRRCGRLAQPPRPVADRFWSKVRITGPDECWEWQGAFGRGGYGQFASSGRLHRTSIVASRMAFMLSQGLETLPSGVYVCHTCDNRSCVNPRHLFPGTAADNIHDAVAKGRMHLGERHGHAKLTAAQIPVIRRYLAAGVGCTAIARQLGVSRGAILGIHRNVNWRHLTEGV